MPPLFTSLPDVLATDYDGETPWLLLGEPLSAALENLPDDAIEVPLGPDIRVYGPRIAIGKGTRIHPGAVIEGPVRIGCDVEVRPGAFIRGGCWIGDGCVVGSNTEVKRSILLDSARAPHLNYVGDSILGVDVNLGAGSILSNFRHDGEPIEISTDEGRVPTGLHKLGAILGDGVQVGCNCVLHPGVVVGSGTRVYPGIHLRPSAYPADAIIKLRQELEIVDRVSGP